MTSIHLGSWIRRKREIKVTILTCLLITKSHFVFPNWPLIRSTFVSTGLTCHSSPSLFVEWNETQNFLHPILSQPFSRKRTNMGLNASNATYSLILDIYGDAEALSIENIPAL